MHALLLTAALLTGQPTRADLVMAAAVEDFVRTADPDRGSPEPYRSLIAGLGADCWSCRERASRKLRTAAVPIDGVNGLHWLFWGRRDPDPEIRLRCNNLLRDLNPCPPCFGTGWCRTFDENEPNGNCANCGAWGWNHGDPPEQCGRCGGVGSAWPKGAFE
jgi:hypothetical protein